MECSIMNKTAGIHVAALRADHDANDATRDLNIQSLRFDPKDYEQFVADYDLTEAQRVDLMQAIWSIMVACVDLGFGFSPLQHVLGNETLDAEALRLLDSPDISDSKHISAADAFNASAQETDL